MSNRKYRRLAIAIGAAFGAAIGISALPARLCAADLGSMFINGQSQIPTQPVEFGTGWYIRGDAAYARDTLPQVNEWGLFPATSSAIQNTYSLGFGGGYKFPKYFRTDVTFDYRQPISVDDSSTGTVANGQRWDVLANGYIDLGTWYGVTPYVGAGVGAAFGMTKITTFDPAIPCTANGTIECYEEHISTSFAWALMAGFAYQIFPHAYIDFGYRYLDLGDYSFYDSSLWPQLNGDGYSAVMSSRVQEFRLGFRYMID